MGIPVFFGITLIIVFLVNYSAHKTSHETKEKNDAFWERERKANTTRKKDISNLNFITIPECLSSVSGILSEEIQETEAKISALSEKKIVNFSGKTNTDLKLEYGTANFQFLSEYDNNYIKLVQLLQKYARLLAENDQKERAIEILDFGISIAPEVNSIRKLREKISVE